MKKLTVLLAAVLLLVPGVAGAMIIEKGTFEISGASALTYSSMTFKDGASVDTTQVNVNALGNYYFMPNFGAGLLVGYSSSEVEDVESSSLSLGPVVKYQFPMAEQLNLFVIGSAGYQKYEFSDDTSADGWYGTIGGGVSYYLTSSFSIDALLRYEYDSLSGEGEDITADGFLVGFGVSVFLR